MSDHPARKLVVAGGTGYLGAALAARLVDRGDEVVILTRGAERDGNPRHVHWDGASRGPWAAALDGADAVVNVTGESIDVRPTRRTVQRLIDSRVRPIVALRDAIIGCTAPPSAWVQITAVGVFGDAGDAVLDEDAIPSGTGPQSLVGICLAWERAFDIASAAIERPVHLRLGAVLGGGAGDRLTTTLGRLVRLGMGGRAGSGRQWIAWVGLGDVVRAVERAIDDTAMSGTYHVVSPGELTNAEMMRTLRRLLRQPIGPPAPATAVRLGAWLKGSNGDLVLASQRVRPTRLLGAAFEFHHDDFETTARAALADAGFKVR